MPKERNVIRVYPVKNLRELMHRIFYNSPSRFTDPTLRLIEELCKNGGCIELNIVELSKKIYVKMEDLEYIIRKLKNLGLLSQENNKICLSDKFIETLRTYIETWRKVLELAQDLGKHVQ